MPIRITDTVTTADGTCPVTLHTPDGTGPWPGVVMYPDAGGVRPTFQEMAARLAGFGYAVLLPDVYYRQRRLGAVRHGDRVQRPRAAQAADDDGRQRDARHDRHPTRPRSSTSWSRGPRSRATRSASAATAWAAGRR